MEKVCAILRAYDQGDSPSAIARHHGSDIRTIGGVLRRYRDRSSAAKTLMLGLAPDAITAWSEAIPIASKRGDHRPAKELLQAVGIVETGQKPTGGPSVAVQIVLGSPGNPLPYDPLAKP